MRLLRAALGALALAMALTLIPVPPAWACSCAAPDASLQVSLEITDSAVAPAENPWGGDGAFGTTVDLRGVETTVLGDLPAALDGQVLDEVPILAAVLDDPNMQDSCGTPQRPAAGSDLEVTGVVNDEGAGPFIYTGPCSGSLTVLADPDPAFEEALQSSGGSGRGPLTTVAVGAGVALLGALVVGGALWRPQRDR